MIDALAVPPGFFRPMNWHIIQWLHSLTWRDWASFGLKWIAVSIFTVVVWSITMHYFGHDDEDDDE